MRLAEKTIELNFCGQFAALYGGPCFWFGLTQRQEARAGFDAVVRLNARLYVFQFKASRQDVRGARRFHAPHPQLRNLTARAQSSRSVFYALPEVGTTAELRGSTDLLGRTWLLDASELTDIEPPLTPSGTPRKNETHYFDLTAPLVRIHSPVYERKLVRADHLDLAAGQGRDAGLVVDKHDFEGFWSRPRRFTGTVAALAIASIAQ